MGIIRGKGGLFLVLAVGKVGCVGLKGKIAKGFLIVYVDREHASSKWMCMFQVFLSVFPYV